MIKTKVKLKIKRCEKRELIKTKSLNKRRKKAAMLEMLNMEQETKNKKIEE